MKYGIQLLALILLTATNASASPASRGSSMNLDDQMNATLFKVLQASVGTVPHITTEAGGSLALKVNSETLSCTSQSCAINWDFTSTPDTQAFQNALYDAFAKSQVVKPIVSVTGTIEYKFVEANGDQVSCFFWTPSTPYSYKECTLQVSDQSWSTDDHGPEGALYTSLLNAAGGLNSELQALLTVFSTGAYKPAGVNVVHTLYTNMAVEGYRVSRSFSQTDAARSGVRLTLNGSRMVVSNEFRVDKIEVENYVLPHPGGIRP